MKKNQIIEGYTSAEWYVKFVMGILQRVLTQNPTYNLQDAVDFSISKAIDEIDDYMRGNESKSAYIVTGICDALELFEEQPTVDAVPVVHGEWIEHKWAEEVSGFLISNFECSQCHMWKRYNTNFCPECGADMRKKAK